MSKICDQCNAKRNLTEKGKISQAEYVEWMDTHLDTDCEQNYEGSSGGMEAKSAVKMWGRSKDYKLRYVNMISDGDSSSYASLRAMNGGTGPYGTECQVEKLVCVNYVSKRFGFNVREGKRKFVEDDEPEETLPPKKKRKLSLEGRGKLTEVVINHLQYYFSVSMKMMIGTSAEAMRNEILSSYFHCSSTDDNPQHHLCTKGKNSWCFYNRILANNEVPPSHDTMKIHFKLGKQELAFLKQIYERLTSDDLMKKCLKGLTQNSNESLHHRIWNLCPKHQRANKRMVDFAVATAIARYNIGYLASSSSLFECLGIEVTTAVSKHLKQLDRLMDSPIRRKTRIQNLKRDMEYAAGGF
ncbi:uncharacterized protein [Palaemon carinicauda]|uniref:uncharacterized protein n=1 Tax=Palaemon carinicauda TaxID=392227 RepID=UPI0035B67A8E